MSHIDLEVKGEVAVVTLNRPERRNAINLAMWQNLSALFKQLHDDTQVRAVILTGSGNCFSAGADISEFSAVRSSSGQAAEYESVVEMCCDAICRLNKPTIAAIKGFCMGGACHIAMSCDFRYADPATVFAIPAARLSIVYSVKGTSKLLALVGVSNAKKILYTADSFKAAKAEEMGLVDCISADVMEAANQFANQLAGNAPLSIAGAKVLLNGMAFGNGELDMTDAERVISAAVDSEDYTEAYRAFETRRSPSFKGR